MTCTLLPLQIKLYNELYLFSLRSTTRKTNRLKSVKKAKVESEYDQEIPQSQTADNPVAPRGRAAQPSRDTRKTN